MLFYILRRLVALIPVILVVGIVVFALVHLTPGDPAAVMPDYVGWLKSLPDVAR